MQNDSCSCLLARHQLTRSLSTLFLHNTGVYDTGTIRIKKQEEDVLQAARREAGTLALPGTSRSYTLYSELNSLYNVSLNTVTWQR